MGAMIDPRGLDVATPPVVHQVGLAFEDFFAAEHERLYRALCVITRDSQEAEEIAQEALLKVWERWDRVSGLEDPTGYLYRTSMNVLRSRIRRVAVGLRRHLLSAQPSDELAAAEARATIGPALGELTEMQRAAIVLIDLLGYSSQEAGDVLRRRAGAVRTLASRGRTRLRHQIGDDDA
jgi:RNA polymerase sigma-70 factor (ECF subfamily)